MIQREFRQNYQKVKVKRQKARIFGLLITLVPKFLLQRFLIRYLNNFEILSAFEWLDYLVECPNVSTINCNQQ